MVRKRCREIPVRGMGESRDLGPGPDGDGDTWGKSGVSPKFTNSTRRWNTLQKKKKCDTLRL